MAKNKMKLKIKPQKRVRNKSVELSDSDKFKSVLYTLIGVLVFIGVVYGLILLM